MHQIPHIPPASIIRDSHGTVVGLFEGFRPHPVTGRLGLEIQLLPDAGDTTATRDRTLWIDDKKIVALRRDEIVLDLSLDELKRLAHGPTGPAGRALRPTR